MNSNGTTLERTEGRNGVPSLLSPLMSNDHSNQEVTSEYDCSSSEATFDSDSESPYQQRLVGRKVLQSGFKRSKVHARNVSEACCLRSLYNSVQNDTQSGKLGATYDFNDSREEMTLNASSLCPNFYRHDFDFGKIEPLHDVNSRGDFNSVMIAHD